MTPKEVKAKLAERNLTQTALAKKWRLQTGVVNQFIHRKFTSARLEKRLAKELGVPVEVLRGERGV